MVRVAVGGISHETNTFATRALGLTEYAAFRPQRGDRILRATGGGYMGGLCDAGRELGFDLVPLLLGNTEPSGTIADAAFEKMRDELIASLQEAVNDTENGGVDGQSPSARLVLYNRLIEYAAADATFPARSCGPDAAWRWRRRIV